MKIGDRVKYSREFCQSIGCYTGEIPFARGVITEITNLGETKLARILWNGPDTLPNRVNITNLTLANNPERV